MKPSLLKWLCCPVCQDSLTVEAFLVHAMDEVEEGKLTCAICQRFFPIIRGIPRMLPDALAHLALRFHPDFFNRHANAMDAYRKRCRETPKSRSWQLKARTIQSYSYQWRTFKEMLPHWEEVFLRSVSPLEPSFFHRKFGLDAGCGFGRSLYYATSYGAEVIGIDLSEAVESARENTRNRPGCHVVQADIYHLPFRKQSFDFIYSIGVLDHLPDPEGGFSKLTELLLPNAPISIWVYSRGRGRQIAVFNLVRSITTHLPPRLLNLLCLLGAAGQWVLWILPYRLLHRIPATRRLAKRLPFTWHERYPFRVLHTDWFDGLSVPLVNYYRQEEITQWYRDAGFEQIVTDSLWGCDGGGRTVGYAP